MQLADLDDASTAELPPQLNCSAAAVELASTSWYRRHHVGLKEGFVREGTRNDAHEPHMGLADELDEVLADCTTDTERTELAALAARHGCECIGEVVREAIAAEVSVQNRRATAVAQRAAEALAGGRAPQTADRIHGTGDGTLSAGQLAALIDTY